jgi:hypothetical protein
VPDVRGLSHNTAIAVLTGEGFFNVCCAGSPSHAQHSQSAKVLWQECYEPATMDLGDVVYLSFMPK